MAFNKVTGLIDWGELARRALKYLIEGLMVAIAAYAIPKRSLNIDEIVLLALTAAATFSILDTYVPSMAVTARSGAGFGIGANMRSKRPVRQLSQPTSLGTNLRCPRLPPWCRGARLRGLPGECGTKCRFLSSPPTVSTCPTSQRRCWWMAMPIWCRWHDPCWPTPS